jgi:hypothetical protein
VTRRPYRLTPLRPVLRVVLDDRMPLDRRLERELRVRELARKVAVVAFLVACAGVPALLAAGAAVALRWMGR